MTATLGQLLERERELHKEFAARYQQAQLEDRLLRSQAWVTDKFHFIANIQCRHLTLQDLIDLEYSQNGYITGQPITDGDTINLLWLLSRHYRYNSPNRKRWFILWHLRNTDRIRARVDALAYIEHCFADAPKQAKEDAGGKPINSKRATLCWMPSIINKIAGAYGWSKETIKQLPVFEAFSLLYEIDVTEMAKAGKTKPLPPAKAEKIRSEFLAKLTDIIQQKEVLVHAQKRN